MLCFFAYIGAHRHEQHMRQEWCQPCLAADAPGRHPTIRATASIAGTGSAPLPRHPGSLCQTDGAPIPAATATAATMAAATVAAAKAAAEVGADPRNPTVEPPRGPWCPPS